jgi:hypothetical protein
MPTKQSTREPAVKIGPQTLEILYELATQEDARHHIMEFVRYCTAYSDIDFDKSTRETFRCLWLLHDLIETLEDKD